MGQAGGFADLGWSGMVFPEMVEVTGPSSTVSHCLLLRGRQVCRQVCRSAPGVSRSGLRIRAASLHALLSIGQRKSHSQLQFTMWRERFYLLRELGKPRCKGCT